MRLTRIIKDKLLIEVDSKRVSRGDVKEFSSNFIRNFYKSYSLLIFIRDNCKDDEIRRTALGQHVISLVSICETFLRDVFNFIVTIDPNFKKDIISTYNLKMKNPIPNVVLEIDEILSEYFNFQDIRDIEYAFKPMIIEEDFFNTIGNFVLPFYSHKTEEVRKFCLNISISNWKELFNEIIKERHKTTHDANYITKLDIDNFERYQKVMFYFPQVFTFWISEKYSLPYFALHIKDMGSIPYILRLEDLSEDWEVVEEKE